ncbi:MAG: chemotaxis protein CheA [Helicobacteraceae bacterium]|nr:chemotaxis protein CheA [Helicobacteraceae bacterium]
MNPLLEQFLQEARENLAFIDQNIEAIGGDDPELLNSVFRAAHTLKGGSGIVGFESVKEITHHAEDLLDLLRSGQIEFQESMTESLFNAFDEVLNLVEAAEETEDIVDSDPETVEQIVSELRASMGKSNEADAWEAPFAMLESPAEIVNLPFTALNRNSNKLELTTPEMDETAFAQPRLYGIIFDIDESSMVYGNDPIYTLSLLGDAVIDIHVCMSETCAKGLLSGEDEEGLLLRCQITAVVYGTYDEIEESLFNFLDEIKISPLSSTALLEIDSGEHDLQLDVLKELNATVSGFLASSDKASLKAEIEKTLPLIGQETIQYAQLNRFLMIMDSIKDEDFAELNAFFSTLDLGTAYSADGIVATSPATTEVSKDTPTPVEIVKEEVPATEIVVVDEHIETNLQIILEQQLLALETMQGDDTLLPRVVAILELTRKYYANMPATFNSTEETISWIKSQLGLESESAPVVEAVKEVVATPVVKVVKTTPIPAVKAPEVVKEVTPEPVVKTVKATPTPEPKDDAKKTAPAKAKAVVGKTVKIDQESIDNLMNIVGELLVAKNSLPYLAEGVDDMSKEMISRGIMEKYTFINRLSEQLQDLIMSMRMLPISYVFDRYPKLVRDISKKLGKKVNLSMDGGETKLDKNMIEMLADPMIHIMRNSLDHGIEDPETRTDKGKTAEGNVDLRAFAQSDKIIIEIKDDGAGINTTKVISKVIDAGLMTMEQIDALSDNEKAELVLLPGLSTADEISEFSGRGVGMDVVKKSIEGFGGTINIVTVPNQGTTITLAIPVSLAVTSLLHIFMNDIHYGIPMDNVNETVKIARSEIEYLHNEAFVYLRGEVIPLLFIKSMLNEDALDDEALSVVVLEVKGNLIAIVVNEFLGQLDVVQKPLEGVMEGHQIFSGTALLGNGQIILAIDPLGILGIAHQLKDEMEAKVG